MVTEFAEVVAGWGAFYNLAASAAFTLVGLLFVAVSINIDVIAKLDEKGDIRILARQTFKNFIEIMAFGFIFLIPTQTPFGVGIPLLFIGIIELIRTAGILLWFRRSMKSQRLLTLSDLLGNLLIPNIICYLVLVWIAFSILEGNTRPLNWMVLVVIYLAFAATRGSWDLMMRIAEIKRDNKEIIGAT